MSFGSCVLCGADAILSPLGYCPECHDREKAETKQVVDLAGVVARVVGEEVSKTLEQSPLGRAVLQAGRDWAAGREARRRTGAK